jgi:predicted acyltransferase
LRGLTVAAMLLVNNAGDWSHVFSWLEHAEWHGCTPADFIFPFFLFIVGVSMYFALAPKLERDANLTELSTSIFWRGARLFLLGVVLHLIAQWLIPGRNFRLMGVLQRIGICFVIVGMIALHVRSIKMRWLILMSILLGYSALLLSGVSLQADLNVVDRVDTVLLGKYAYSFNPITGLAHEPEGILSTIPSVATVLLGLQAGAWLRAGHAQRLWQVGLMALPIAWLGSHYLPFNKQLWTPTFVLWTAGFAFLCLSLAHQLIDLRGWPALGRSFGVNAIAAYAGSWVVTCFLTATGWAGLLYQGFFVTFFTPHFGASFTSFAFAAGFTGVFWILMWLFDRFGWRISV